MEEIASETGMNWCVGCNCCIVQLEFDADKAVSMRGGEGEKGPVGMFGGGA